MGRVLSIALLILARGQCAPGEQPLKAGIEAYEHRDYSKAIELLSPLAMTLAEPRDAAGITALGFSYYFTGSYEKALPHLKRAASQDQDSVDVTYALGLSALRLHIVSEARSAFAQMFHVPPESARARLLVAKFMLSEQMEELAESELGKAAEMEPALPQLHYLLGEIAIFRGDLDKGIELLQKELVIDPANSFAHYRLGDAFYRKELWAQAAGELRKSIWLNPDFSSPYILLGKVYFKKDMKAEAREILKRGLAMDPNNSAGHYVLGTIYREAGQTALAQEEFALVRKLKK